MTTVDITPVDERDTSWEDGRPLFRVYLHGSEESSTGGWTDTYGNDQPACDREDDVQSRMLARRRDPVVVPAADRIPSDVAPGPLPPRFGRP